MLAPPPKPDTGDRHGPFEARRRTHRRTAQVRQVNGITSLLQGRDGYLWIGTLDGLVRFDGVRFTTFDAATARGLPSSG